MSIKPAALFGQVLCYAAFAAFVGYFSGHPRYQHLPTDRALVKLSLAHFGARTCRQRTPGELQRLPPNMRAPLDCPRRRANIIIEVDLDGQPLYRGELKPTGLSGDGISTLYRRFELPAGAHHLAARMNDDATQPGFKYQHAATLTLQPAQVLVIDFNPDQGGLFFS